MFSLKDGDVCPGMKFFGLRLDGEGYDSNPKIKKQMPILVSTTICDMCNCARTKKMQDHKFYVRCNFDDMERQLRESSEFYDQEKPIWELKWKVLKGESDKINVKMVMDNRLEQLDEKKERGTRFEVG